MYISNACRGRFTSTNWYKRTHYDTTLHDGTHLLNDDKVVPVHLEVRRALGVFICKVALLLIILRSLVPARGGGGYSTKTLEAVWWVRVACVEQSGKKDDDGEQSRYMSCGQYEACASE